MSTPQIPLDLAEVPALGESRPIHDFKYWHWGLSVFVGAWCLILLAFFPDPLGLVSRNWPLVGVGFVAAILGNSTAVGGGFVFIPVMILVYQLPSVLALKVALGSQSVGMTSGAIGWLEKRAVPMRPLMVAIPPMLAGSTVSSLLIQPNPLLVKGLFGPASIFLGVVTLILLGRSQGRDELPRKAYLPLILFSFVGGTLTGWIAIGEGEVIAAFLMLGFALRAERGIGMGVVLLSVNSIYLTIIHQFFLGGIPWEIAMFTALGCVFGGRLGPYVTRWVGPQRLKIAFALIAMADGLVFIIQFLLSGELT
jgi:uncharacterized membrane protein YfcA